jgi:uncharacterized protein (DUF3820 family)
MTSVPSPYGDPPPVMPFGKYKGRSPNEIPLGYLRWLLDNCHLPVDLWDEVQRVIDCKEQVHGLVSFPVHWIEYSDPWTGERRRVKPVS